jgi:hypothetical protein
MAHVKGWLVQTPWEDFHLDRAGVLISINTAGNLDVIPCKDADAPRKQPLAHTPALLGSLSLEGSVVRITPWPLPWLSTGNRRTQVNNTVHRHVGLQGTNTSLLWI